MPIDSMPNRDENRQRIPGQTVIAEPEETEPSIVSVRFPTGLTVHYEANDVEEVQHGYKILASKGGALVAIVNKASGFIIEVQSPLAVETREEPLSLKSFPFGPSETEAGTFDKIPVPPAGEVQPSKPWPRDNSRPPITEPRKMDIGLVATIITIGAGCTLFLLGLAELLIKILL